MEKKNISKRVVVIILAILTSVLIFGGVVWLFIIGRLVYMDPKTIACGTDIVEKYNDAMYYKIRQGQTEPSIDDVGLKSLVATIKSKEGYKKDPTCQSIIFLLAVRDDNFNEAKTAYDILISLHKKRIFVDPNLRSDQPLFMYVHTLNGLSRPGSGVTENQVYGD